MREPKIRFAVDPETGSVVDAVSGLLPKKDYHCLKCKGRLTIYQGEYQIRHFRHYGDKEAEACPLYYGGEYENQKLLRELQTSEIEKAESIKRIRLVVEPKAYGRTLSFYGILPVIDRLELPKGADLHDVLSSLTFAHKGVRRSLTGQVFHPSEPEARVELDPSSEEYLLKISSPVVPLQIAGSWTAEPLKNGDVFGGTRARAEQIDSPKNLAFGDIVFVLQATQPGSLPAGSELHRLGNWFVVSFEVNATTVAYLEGLSGMKAQDVRPFHVDIVIPTYADPSSQSPIMGMPGRPVIVAISPPRNLDPEFEVVTVPLEKGGAEPIPKRGTGKPRWYRTSFPEKDPQRLSVHWADRHRAILLYGDARAEAYPTLATRLLAERTVSVEVRGDSPSKVTSWESRPVAVRVNKDSNRLQESALTVSAPEGIKFDVIASFPAATRVGPTVRRDESTIEDLEKEFYAWVREGVTKLVLDFDSLGAVEISFRGSVGRARMTPITEIRPRIEKMDPLPVAARWPLVRTICGAKPGTLHSFFPGMKKRVRRALMEVRANRR